jgi:hypothetical protein
VAVLAGHQAVAQGFDNPTDNGTPCVHLNRYEVEPIRVSGGDGPMYRGDAMIENVCGRAVDVRFCFQYGPNEEGGVDTSCYQGPVRPWARANVASQPVPERISGPSYEWRYLP